MPLIKDGLIAVDPWISLEDATPMPGTGAVTVSRNRWQTERASLLMRNAPLGLRLANNQPVQAIADDVQRLTLIVLHFPKFTDGRAYSQARLLRERLGYGGELRATGSVLRDQLLFMHRCGFDAFEIDAAEPADIWTKALAEFNHFYQPTGDHRPARFGRI